jgi:poly(3-hydroxyalkanoate) synthetase
MNGFDHFFQAQREIFRLWQETADELVRQTLSSPFFLESNSFLTKQSLDLYESWLNYWSAVGFDKNSLHETVKKLGGFSSNGAKIFAANIKFAQTAGFLPKTAPTPYQVVLENEHFRLLHYLSNAKKKTHAPVLIVSSLVGKYYILDLTRGRSYVSFLLEEGFDVFIVDWTTNEKSAKLGVEYYA